MDAVGADQRGSRDRLAAGEAEAHAIALLGIAGAARAEADAIRVQLPHGGGQRRMEIGAVQHQIRGSVALDRDGAEIEQLPGFARVPEAHFLAFRNPGRGPERVAEAEREQHAVAVGADLHAGAHFAEFRRLLEHVDREATLDERKGRRQPAYAAAGYNNLGFCGIFHSWLPFLIHAGQHSTARAVGSIALFGPDRLG